jgi:hypothetical protein
VEKFAAGTWGKFATYEVDTGAAANLPFLSLMRWCTLACEYLCEFNPSFFNSFITYS